MEIYSGETIEGIMVFTDDDGQLISDFSNLEIKLLIKNLYDDYSILIEKSQMSISGEKVKFSISSDLTSDLKISAKLELKVIENGKIKIAKCDRIEVIDNHIKDL